MTRRKSHRAFEHDRDLPADTGSGEKRDPQAGRLRVGDVLLRQGEARASDLGEGSSAANSDARGDALRKEGPHKGKVGR